VVTFLSVFFIGVHEVHVELFQISSKPFDVRQVHTNQSISVVQVCNSYFLFCRQPLRDATILARKGNVRLWYYDVILYTVPVSATNNGQVTDINQTWYVKLSLGFLAN
jgi:hypothetical protein